MWKYIKDGSISSLCDCGWLDKVEWTSGGSSPTISFNPASFTFSATQGGANPSTQTLNISNSGGGTLNWTLSDDAAWLSLSPTSGTNTGSSILTVNIAGMSAGSYNATIAISASGATNTPQPVPVALIVNSQSTTTKLIGADDAASLNESGNYILLTKFQAVATGQITEFKVKSGATAQVKVAIYADNSGEPGGRLSYNDTAQNVVAGWNTLSIPALNVTSGTYYWLGVIGNSNGAVQYVSGSSSNFRYKAATFDSFTTWPDPAGTGYSNYPEGELVAGWGATGTVPLSITTTSLPYATVGASYSRIPRVNRAAEFRAGT